MKWWGWTMVVASGLTLLHLILNITTSYPLARAILTFLIELVIVNAVALAVVGGIQWLLSRIPEKY